MDRYIFAVRFSGQSSPQDQTRLWQALVDSTRNVRGEVVGLSHSSTKEETTCGPAALQPNQLIRANAIAYLMLPSEDIAWQIQQTLAQTANAEVAFSHAYTPNQHIGAVEAAHGSTR